MTTDFLLEEEVIREEVEEISEAVFEVEEENAEDIKKL